MPLKVEFTWGELYDLSVAESVNYFHNYSILHACELRPTCVLYMYIYVSWYFAS